MRDFRRLEQDPPLGISAAPRENNIMAWTAVIFGPDGTPWEGGTFTLDLVFSEEFPNKPPVVRFTTKMFHPNIYLDGSICLDILQNQWSPIYDVSAILTSIQSLLCDPNPNSPANSEAAQLFQSNKREYNRRVREVVEQSWHTAGGDDDDDDDEEEEEAPAMGAPAAAAASSSASAPSTLGVSAANAGGGGSARAAAGE